MKTQTPTRKQLIRRLKAVAKTMLKLGLDLECYGGAGEVGEHGREMIGASAMAREWAQGMETFKILH